jgi:predicted lipoprotein with Yx(FWY)xxD motif
MKRRLALAFLPVAVALAAAGCGTGGSSGTTGPAADARPATASTAASLATGHTKLGTVLVDGKGRTLYLFEKDKDAMSSCYGACASVWPPLTSAKRAVAGGLPAAKIGTTKRSDGTTEVTYAGHPLYTYAGDGKPGQAQGQGLDQFGAEWYVLAPSGHKIDNDS